MDTTDLVEAHGAGDPKAISQVLPLVYRELRSLARKYLIRERSDHTLQPTAVVHEAYIRLVDNSRISWQGKTHFFAIAANEMRRVLVEHARGHKAEKRGGGAQRITLDEAVVLTPDASVDVLDLDDALLRLRRLDPRQSHVAELRFFGGLTVEETAHVLGVSERTVKQDWRFGKAWLMRELGERRSP